MKKDNKYPIRVVAGMTGLSEHVIRIWEKRYQAVTPQRTETNRRIYSDADVQKLSLLKRATEKGFSIGQIADHSIHELRELMGGNISETYPAREGKIPSAIINQGIAAVYEMDARKLENILLEASVTLSRPVLIEELIGPFMEEIGRLWQQGALRIYHEHLASAVIRKFLSDLLGGIRPPVNAPALVATTPAGQVHEFGALTCALTAASQGWEVTYLGPNLPAEEIAAAALEKNARVVLLSIIYPPGDPQLNRELEKLTKLLPHGILLIVGGSSALSYRTSLETMEHLIFTDIRQLKEKLRDISLET